MWRHSEIFLWKSKNFELLDGTGKLRGSLNDLSSRDHECLSKISSNSKIFQSGINQQTNTAIHRSMSLTWLNILNACPGEKSALKLHHHLFISTTSVLIKDGFPLSDGIVPEAQDVNTCYYCLLLSVHCVTDCLLKSGHLN